MNFFDPFSGQFPVTQAFGERITNPAGHTGIDYALPLGTPVLAAAVGMVYKVTRSTKGYGNHLILDHGAGLQTLYAHLSTCSLKCGAIAAAGTQIGLSGSSGNSTGPHLHFEVRQHGLAVDPALFLRGSAGLPEGGQRWRVVCDALNVRSGPGLRYPVMRVLRKGEVFAELARHETLWVRLGQREWAAVVYETVRNAETG